MSSFLRALVAVLIVTGSFVQIAESSKLDLCSNSQNVIFLFDLSGSVQSKSFWRKFKNQRVYAKNVLKEYETGTHVNVRFSLAAYSRYTAAIKSLTNPRSGDTAYMKKSLSTFRNFKTMAWDNPKNGFSILTKRGNRYSHMGLALEEQVRLVLETVEGDPNFGRNTTAILFSDGRPEYFQFRNKQRGKMLFSDEKEFVYSLAKAVEQKNRLKSQFPEVRIHCVMLQNTKYSARLKEAMCDTHEAVGKNDFNIEATPEITDCIGSLIMPSLSPSLSPTSLPTSIPTNSPIRKRVEIPSFSPTKLLTKSPSHSPSSTPSVSPSLSPSSSPISKPSGTPEVTRTFSPTLSPSSSPSRSPSSSSTTVLTGTPKSTRTATPTLSPSSSSESKSKA